MKFLCPSCKAKYQIGDEKVAGRSVRMKCRKCGYVIQVSSVPGLGDALPGSEPPPAAIDALSDVSAAPLPVQPPPPADLTPSPPPSAVGSPRPAAVSKGAPTPPSAPSSTRSPLSAQRPEVKKIPVVGARPTAPKPAPTPSTAKAPVAPAPAPAAPAPVAPPRAAAAPAAPAAAAPKAPASQSSPQKPASNPLSGAALGLKGDKRTLPESATASPLPAAPKSTANVAKPAPAPAPAPASAFVPEEEERTRIADVGALAGAFSLAVGGASEAASGGASDTASPDSLSMPADEWFVGINGVPVGPIRLSELRSKAASGSVNRESLVWRDGFEDWRPLGTFPELSAIVDESLSSVRASLTPFTPPVTAAAIISGNTPSPTSAVAIPATSSPEVEAYAGAANGVTGAAVVTDELVAAGVPRRAGTSPAAWIAIAIALMFGLTMGFVFFNKGSKTVEVVKYVDRVVPGAASGGVVAAPEASVAVIDNANAPADAKNAIKRPQTAKSATATASTAESDKGISGLKGLQGLAPGPGRGPDGSGPSGTPSGGGQLDGAQIQSTVSHYTGSVKRACWQPALDTRDKDAPTTARVSVAITVLPSGSVSNAVVNGGDPKGYRGLSQCISSRVRGWQFPPSGDTTTVNVPFVFAAQ
ncbi:MAG TPA: GYF domain-containing protein [Polyangiaceae bacterium]|nr:GYF domain-containing protein [Polyangiaceae bacterium]